MRLAVNLGKNGKDEWLTPPDLITSLGAFDLDPCSPRIRPWPTAAQHYTIEDDGLSLPWQGRVWCNPPYGRETGRWLFRCAEHGNAIALIFARTDTKDFHEQVWKRAHAILFLRGRLRFYHVNGKIAPASCGAPSCLVAYDGANSDVLSRQNGAFVRIK